MIDASGFLPGLPTELIIAAYRNAPGNEIESGKFLNPESSAALVANAFGYFLDKEMELTPLPGTEDCGWPAQSVRLEAIVRFPWSGGRHPCLDVLVVTKDAIIGIESKRFEPFRSKTTEAMSDAYWREVWGTRMTGFQRCRDALRSGSLSFSRLDAAQLIKHAFGLRTAVTTQSQWAGKRPILFYLYCEPERWPDGIAVSLQHRAQHRAELDAFANLIAGDEVSFASCTYNQLLNAWLKQPSKSIRDHASLVSQFFCVGS